MKFAAVHIKLTQQNAFEVFNLANLYENEALRERSFEEIQKTFPNMKISDDLKTQREKLKKIEELEEEKDEEKTQRGSLKEPEMDE